MFFNFLKKFVPSVIIVKKIFDKYKGILSLNIYLKNTLNTFYAIFNLFKTLENRQKEHDLKRRKLKVDWTKQKKQLVLMVE